MQKVKWLERAHFWPTLNLVSTWFQAFQAICSLLADNFEPITCSKKNYSTSITDECLSSSIESVSITLFQVQDRLAYLGAPL